MRSRFAAAVLVVVLGGPAWAAPVGTFVKGEGAAGKKGQAAPSQVLVKPGAPPGAQPPDAPEAAAEAGSGTADLAPTRMTEGADLPPPPGGAESDATGKGLPTSARTLQATEAEAAPPAGDAAAPPTPPPTGVGLTTTSTQGWAEVSGWVFSTDGGGKGLTRVAYWPVEDGWSSERGAAVVRAERSARYQVRLPDGRWLGTACDAEAGFRPLFWELVVADGEVVSYRERDDRMPVVESASVAATGAGGTAVPGDRVRLEGSGFGCSGGVVVTQGGREVARVTSFSVRTDGRVEFGLPEGRWVRGLPLGFSYAHGRWRSAPAVTGVVPYLPPAARTGTRAGRFPGDGPVKGTE